MPKRILTGVVTSNQNEQTVTVSVERRFKHPLLQKTVRKSKKYRAHDEKNAFNVGDQVRIIECAPKSKTKRWKLSLLERAFQLNRNPRGPVGNREQPCRSKKETK